MGGDFRLKTCLRLLVDKFNLDMILSPTQSVIFRDIDPKDRTEIDAIIREHGLLPVEEIMMRMTGCPNGCARPYMAEIAFVGDGRNSYQIWLGGSPVLTRTAYPYVSKVKDPDMEKALEPVFAMFIEQ